MARANIQTLLPLDRFASIVGIHPLHFNQMYTDPQALPRVCGMPFLQHSWQSADRIGREEIAQAISDAEAMFAREVGFWPAPKYIEDEFSTLRMNKNWLYTPQLQCQYGYFVEAGIQAKVSISAAAPVVYTDNDGDGYKETATIVVATTVTNVDEIRVYYPGYSTPEYEIRPIYVSIVAGVATITCRRELLYLDDLAEVLNPSSFDGLVDANFLATVDVYRVYTDVSDQGSITWQRPLCTQCGGIGCTACITANQTVCTTLLNKRLSLIRLTPADWSVDHYDIACYTEEQNPDQANINYLAGWAYNGSHVVMDPQFERAITYLAVSQLDRPLCACDHIKAFAGHWSEDLAIRQSSTSGSVSYGFDSKVFNNPFGTTRGAVYAWRVASKYKIGEAI
jgi:hypothetical protein